VDSKGKQRKRYLYKQMMTPYEKLKSLADASSYLKAGTTFKQSKTSGKAGGLKM
jgi:hypothetical protein